MTSPYISWIEKTLDPLITCCLKQWLCLAEPADPSKLFLTQQNGGLELLSISLLYKRLLVGKAALFITSKDSGVQQVTRLELESEARDRRKKFKVLIATQQVFSNIPDATRRPSPRRLRNSCRTKTSAAA